MDRSGIGAATLLIGVAVAANAQAVRIRFTDDIDEAPVPSALVTLLSDRELWRADDEGVLVAPVRHPGPNVFTIRHIGFDPITTTLDVPEHGTLKVHVIMHHTPKVLDTVTIAARAADPRISAFDERRMNSVGGQFITLADIERRKPFETLDLFSNRLGLRVVRPPAGDSYIVSTRGVGLTGVECRPRIGIDGAVFGTGFDVDDISPRDIYGIEIYSGASTTPAQYITGTDNGSCGLIMIWTFSGAQASARRP
jgi:hypothetical protein